MEFLDELSHLPYGTPGIRNLFFNGSPMRFNFQGFSRSRYMRCITRVLLASKISFYRDISKSRWDTGSVANVSSSVVTDYSSGASTHWWSRRRMQHQARLYHDNEFSGVYDHATSSNPPLPFRPCAFVCMRGMLRYATLYLHFALRASQQRREWRNLQVVSTDFLRIG